MAAITLPEMKADFIENDVDFHFAKQLLIEEYRQLKRTETVPENLPESAPQSGEFVRRFNSRRVIRSHSFESEIEADVNTFLSSPETDYKIFQRFPEMRHIFLKYNTTLSSSAAVERVFSQTLMIFTPRRNRLSADHFEQALMLKHNRDIFKHLSTKNKN